jgi:recombination protein RecA
MKKEEIDIDAIVRGIKKDFGFASMGRLSDSNVSSKVKCWVSTGSTLLDAAICKGIPIGKITEISGRSATGKSVLCYSILANVQKQGGIGILLDTESAADPEFAKVFGVDVDRLIVSQPDSVEDLYNQTFNLIKRIRETVEPDIPVVICADSCVPPSRAEIEKTLLEPPKVAENAVMNRRALKKIVNEISIHNIAFIGINHIVANPMVVYGPKEISTGGSAWSYFPSVRIKLRTAEIINSKIKGIPEGIKMSATVTKNRLGPPGREVIFPLYYDRGIDDVDSLIEFAKQNGLFGTSRGWLEYEDKKYRHDSLVSLFKEDETKISWLKTECVDLLNLIK